jgi:uncharacterized protein
VRIEVAYALPQRAVLRTYELAASATVKDALRAAAADPAFAGIDLAGATTGVFGMPARGEQLLHEGDRVEIYRPLAVDPKAARRARAEQARSRRASTASKSDRS